MNKMIKKRKRRKLSKLLKKAEVVKYRKPIAPPTKIFKSKKTYQRKNNRRLIQENVND